MLESLGQSRPLPLNWDKSGGVAAALENPFLEETFSGVATLSSFRALQVLPTSSDPHKPPGVVRGGPATPYIIGSQCAVCLSTAELSHPLSGSIGEARAGTRERPPEERGIHPNRGASTRAAEAPPAVSGLLPG